jgi:sorbitol/mannitol transport system substrate-binding protein
MHKLRWKILAAVVGAGLIAWLFAKSAKRPEITIATVNNADMILMQRLSGEFEKENNVKLNWVVLGENVLRQRLTIDIATHSNTFDVITIGSYEAPLWGERGWIVPLDNVGEGYDYNDIFEVIRKGLSFKGKMYALPFYSESSFTYYRKDLFEKASLEMPV